MNTRIVTLVTGVNGITHLTRDVFIGDEVNAYQPTHPAVVYEEELLHKLKQDRYKLVSVTERQVDNEVVTKYYLEEQPFEGLST